MYSIKNYIIRGVSGVLLIKVFGIGLALLNSIVFARAMGPEEYGIYSFAIETMMFISIPVSLGLPVLLTREVSKYNEQKQYGLISGIIKWSGSFVLLAGIIITVITAVVVLLQQHESNNLNVFLWALPIILLRGIGQVRMGSLRGLKKIIYSQVPDALIRPVLVIGFVAVIFFGFNQKVDALIGIKVNIFALFISFLIGLLWLFKALPSELKQAKSEMKKKEWLHEALPFFFIGSVALVNTKLSMVLVGFFRPVSEVGIYKIAVVASSIVSFLLVAVNMTISPLISELYYGDKRDQLQKVLTKTVRSVFSIGLVITLVYYLFGKNLIRFFYGEEYLQAYIPLIILTIGQLVNVGAGSVGNVLSMTGHQRDVIKGQAIAAVVNIILNILLLPIYGIIGAAVATAIGLMVWNFVLIRLLKLRVNLNSSIVG